MFQLRIKSVDKFEATISMKGENEKKYIKGFLYI